MRSMLRHAAATLIGFALLVPGPALPAQVDGRAAATIDTGQVTGALTGRNNDIAVYKGIPYVAPPIGENRWRAPQPARSWDGIREAARFSPIPPQRESPQPQNEDSLYLNVWTPAKNAVARLPVMVWIYGGGFTYGSSSSPLYDGTHLAEHGVVLVSFNYRLNVLSGFAHPALSRASGHGSGNYGLLDQIAALRWVQRNIKAFGGNPDNVTVFGESAGGLSVTALLVSPLTKGLFHKAIIESGSGGQITPLAAAEASGQQLVKKMGLENDPNLVATLRGKAWADFPDATSYRGGPVMDGYALIEHPRDAWAAGRQHNVPIIVGYNHDEATFFTARDGAFAETVDAFRASVRQRFGGDADRVLALYPVTGDADAYWADVAVRTDSRFGVSARQQLRGMFNVTARSWAYHFSYLPKSARDARRGVSHASELPFVFGTLPAAADQTAQDVSEAMMQYWTQFARTGDPNQPGLPEWPAFAKGRESYLELAAPIHADRDLNRAKLDLFDEIQNGTAGRTRSR